MNCETLVKHERNIWRGDWCSLSVITYQCASVNIENFPPSHPMIFFTFKLIRKHPNITRKPIENHALESLMITHF